MLFSLYFCTIKEKKTPVTYLLKLRFTHKDDDGDYELMMMMMMMGKQNVL